jgi:hypothetical protein
MKRIFLALAILLGAVSLAPAQLTQAGVDGTISAQITTNGAGGITGATLRSVMDTMVAATFQAQGANGLILSGTPCTACLIVGTGPTGAVWSTTLPAAYSFTGGPSFAANGATLNINLAGSGLPPFTVTGTTPQIGSNPFATIFPCTGLYSFCASNGSGFQAFLGFTATSLGGSGQSAAAGYLVGQNDIASPGTGSAWGVYSECRVINLLFCAGVELDAQTANATPADIPTPLVLFGAGTGPFAVGAWIYNGGTYGSTFGQYNSALAIGILGTTATGTGFNKGIEFYKGSIVTIAGHAEAINLYQNYELDWYANSGGGIGRLTSDGANLFWNGSVSLSSGQVISWNGDTGLSRDAAGNVYVGNGTQGSLTGSLTATILYAESSFQTGLTTWIDTQTCTAGQHTWDANYLYVCTATNTVKRAALSTF